jgi:hypothetical protein
VNRWRDEQVGGWAGGRQVTDNNRDGLLRIGGSSARPLPHPDSPTCPVQSSLSQLSQLCPPMSVESSCLLVLFSPPSSCEEALRLSISTWSSISRLEVPIDRPMNGSRRMRT